jgi:ATP-dependent helicase Lhr and Lhr-like helicase
MKAYVSGSVNRPPTIPSWFSEMLPLSFDLALEIQRFRKLIKEKINKKESKSEIKKFIMSFVYVDEEIASEILDYFSIQEKFLGIPNEKELIIENYKTEKNYFIFHSLFGIRVNDSLSRAVGFCVGRIGGRDIEIGINDNGFYISGEGINRQKIEKALDFLNEKNLEEVLKEAIEKSEIIRRRFRHCASRALMILRNYKGEKKSVGKQHMKSWFLLHAIKKKDEDFCILKETRREILEDVMDIENTKKVLNWIKENKIKISYKSKDLPSPFSLNLIMQGYSDLIRIEDKIDFVKRIYSEIKKKID